MSFPYRYIVNEYGVPRSTLTNALQKIYPLLQCSNINDLKIRVEKRETTRGKAREIVGSSEHMKKEVHPTYLSKDEESLIVA